jgi:hypothetical protein
MVFCVKGCESVDSEATGSPVWVWSETPRHIGLCGREFIRESWVHPTEARQFFTLEM